MVGTGRGSKLIVEATMGLGRSWPWRASSEHTLLGFFLFLAFSYAVSAQSETGFPTGFALIRLNTSSMVCNGSSGLTPENPGLRQAACLTPFPCLGSGENRSQIAGQCSYLNAIGFSSSRSFSTMFSFNTLKYPTYSPGEGFTFFISPGKPGNVSNIVGGDLGWLDQSAIPSGNKLGNNFAVEFDLVSQTTGGFDDPPGEHVGINVNNLNSTFNITLPDLTTLSSTATLYVWVDYDGSSKSIDLRLSKDDAKPCDPLIYGKNFDLSEVLLDTMYVGFSSSTGSDNNKNSPQYNTQTTVWDWSFSTVGQAENIFGDDERCGLRVSKTAIMGIIIAMLAFLVVIMLGVIIFLHFFRSRKVSALEKEKAQLVADLKKLDFGAREFTYPELSEATKDFSEQIGKGGFGTVFKGTLSYLKEEKTIIAVKKITNTKDSADDAKQLVAEVKVIGRLRHVNIVPVLGWCYERGQMLLVYKYMENGDLDQWIFPTDYGIQEQGMFTWGKRMNILRGVASALQFLHEDFECDETVLHRDIKTRNIMLDGNFNARLGDFGLARFCDRDGVGHLSQQLVGTKGYIAPEYLAMGATQETDIYSFGVLALVVATGRKPIDGTLPGRGHLLPWVLELYDEGRITDAGDFKLLNFDSTLNVHEMKRVLTVGLVCCNVEPQDRPLMHDVVTALQGSSPIFSRSVTPYPLRESYDSDFPAAMDYDDVTIPFEDYFTAKQSVEMTKMDVEK